MKTNFKKFLALFVLFLCLLNVKAQNCASNAGVDQTLCVTAPLTLSGIAGLPQSNPAVTLWTQVSGPNTAAILTPTSISTSVTGLAPGNYVFQLANKCADNLNATDLVVITVLPEPPTSLAGPDLTQCTNTPAQLAANAVVAPFTGTWSAVPSGGTFAPNANAPNATYTPPAGSGVYTLTWSITNGFCTKTDDIKVNVIAPTLPVNAGSDIALSCGGTCVTMAGSDPGLAPPQGGFWSLISGPSTPVITNPTQKNTTVCGLAPGTYTLRWTVSGACGAGFDDMVINVANVFDAPVSFDSYNTLNCQTPRPNTFALSGTALTAGETGVWTLTSGQTGIAFSPNTTTSNVTVTGISTGPYDYTFKWTKTNAAGCTAVGTHTITASNGSIVLSTPPNQTLGCDATSTTFDIFWLYPASGWFSDASSLISYPAGGGGASISKTNETYGGTGTTATFTESNMTVPGVYVFKVTYTNNCIIGSKEVSITVSRTPGSVNAGSDIVLPCNTLNANPIGTSASSGAGFTTNWTQVSGPNTATLSGVNTQSLGMTGLVQGVYNMRLNVSGGAACASRTDEMMVIVTQAAPTIATVGTNATVCYGNYQLGANFPNTPLETVTWTVTPSAGISFLPTANTPNAKISGMLASTIYTLTWTVSNTCGTKTATQVLTTTNTQSPPIPNAQPDQCIVGTGTLVTTLPGSAPAGSVTTWAALDAGSSVSPNNTQNTTATITGANGSYRFVYTLSKTGCTALSDTVIVTKSSAVTSNAGVDINICATTLPASTTLAATAATGGRWSQLSGPTTANITTPTSATSTITGLAAGIYELEWRIKNGVCTDVVDIMQIKVAQTPSIANAGIDQTFCNAFYNTSVTLAGNNPAVGTGYWSVVAAPGASYPLTITNPQQYNTTITQGWVTGTYKLLWTITNGNGCTPSADTMYINMSIAAYAGGSVTTCNATNSTLTGNILTSGTWTQVSGPTATVTPSGSNQAIASGLTTGTTTPNTYTFRYTLPAVGACPSTNDIYTITNYPRPSQANAGADLQLCFNQSTATLTGNIPTVGIGTWVYESGPNNPTAGTANGTPNDTTLNNIVPGLYTYQYQVNTNGACIASVDKVQIIKEAPANAKPDLRVCNTNTINLNATPAIVNTGTWSYISGPVGSSIASVNAPNSAVTGLVPGTYIYRWTVASPSGLGCSVNSDDVQIIIDPAVPLMNAGADTTFCQATVNAFNIGSPSQVGVTYSWTPAILLSNASIAQPQFTGVNNAGTYTYTVKGTIGTCEAFDQVNIIVKPKPITAFTISSPSCNGLITAGNTAAGNIYSWNFGSTANPPTASTVGPHTVTWFDPGPKSIKLIVTNTNGCIDSTTVVFTPACTLPITLTQFNVKWNANKPLLIWKVENGINFKKFEVERSFDGINFTYVNTVLYTNSFANYNFEDISLNTLNTKIYYRLKLVDIGGTYNYSEIRNLITAQKNEVLVFPNPFENTIQINLTTLRNEEYVECSIYTQDGRLLLKKVNNLKKGNNNIEISNLSNYSSGLYMLKVTREDGVFYKKLIKQ